MTRKRKSDIAGIVFDLDGTVLDTFLYIVLNYVHLFDRYQRKCPSLATLITFSGPPLSQVLTQYFPDIPLSELVDEFETFSHAHSNSYSSLYPAEIEVLSQLKDAGYRLALLTTKKRVATEENLSYFGLAKFFETVVAFGECEKTKPDPSGVIEILKRLDLKPSQVFVIGDSDTDILAGKNAGTKTGLVTFGPKRIPDIASDERYASYTDIGRSFLIHE